MLFLCTLLTYGVAAVSAKSLWSSQPASNFSDIIRTAYPVGNGLLAGKSNTLYITIRLADRR